MNFKSILLFLVWILSFSQVYSLIAATIHWWDAGWTIVTSVNVSSGDGIHVFPKKEGTQTLYVTEWWAFLSPFSWSTVVVNILNWQTGSYTVDWTPYNSTHPLWKSGSVNYWVQLPGDPVGVFAPNLTLNIANTSAVSIKQYKYDSIAPVWTIIRIYDMDLWSTGTQITLTGQWTGKRIASEVQCYDGIDVSGCQTARDTTKRPIYNRDTTAAYVLDDIAGNIGNGDSSFSANLVDALDAPITTIPQIFVDRLSPMENEVTFQWIHLDKTNTGYFFATGSTGSVFNLKLYDPESTPNWWVSWIYSYEFTALHIQNHTGVINTITCDLSWTLSQYNADGSLDAQDDRDIPLNCPELWKEGDYIISYTGYDFVGNSVSNNFKIHISPSNILGTIDINPTERHSKFANLLDTYTYDVIIKDVHWNPVYNKDIIYLNQEDSWATATFKTIKTNMVTTPISWNDAIKEIPSWIVTGNDGDYSFMLQAYAPGVFTETFKVILPRWYADYSDDWSSQIRFMTTWLENSFNRPFTWSLSIHNDEFRVWTVQQLDLLLSNIGCLPPWTTHCGPTYEIFDFFDSLNSSFEYEFSVKRNPLHTNDGTMGSVTNPSLDMALNYIGGNLAWTGSPWIDTRPYITYSIWWEVVSYLITLNSSGSATGNLVIANAKFYGAKVIGMIEWIGKQQLSGEDVNFTDFTKWTLRDSIRKNVWNLTRWMSHWQTANNIHYVEWVDIAISGNLPYETLIVKDWNIIIDGDLNTSGQKLGIISLKTDSQSSTIWNIYIKPNVQYMDAIIYADGPVRSVDNTWNEYPADSPTRTIDLSNQLFIYGSLFTKNTIGGALGASWTFILPWGYTTSDFDKAVQFDLNYIRTGNAGWDRTSPTENIEKDEYSSLIIMYNSEIQSNPPKWFSYK